MKIEHTILSELVHNERYNRKVLAFLKDEYFDSAADRAVFDLICRYMDKYNGLPSQAALTIEMEASTNLQEEVYKEAIEFVSGLEKTEVNLDWLVDKTEAFCKDRAIYLGLMEAIKIVDQSSNDSLSVGAIPQILSEALAVSFDNHIGHDYIEDFESRFEFYNTKDVKIPFDLDAFNQTTNGGVSRKTLNILMAGTGVGKSMVMCHMAAANLRHGLNVLYITMEMSEEMISERIDANLLKIPTNQLRDISKEKFYGSMAKLRDKIKGKLIVKDYPTAQAGAGHFRHLLSELKLKRNFIPDVIYVDYLNICSSSRMKMGNSVNSYTYIKAIAEELRGLAVEANAVMWSATQTNRDGFNNSDVGLENTSESFGLPATADLMFALIDTGELKQLNQIMVKKLKHRNGDLGYYGKFVIGVDRKTMTLYDVEGATDLAEDDPPPKSDKRSKFQNFT